MKARALLTLLFVLAAVSPAHSANPYERVDTSYLSLTGTIASTGEDQFTIDYGNGLITVEMDDWDWFDESSQLNSGERVTVYGRVDDGLYERRTIEADSVYIYGRNTFVYASDADEEGDYYNLLSYYPPTPRDGTWISVSGKVKDAQGREFTLSTGNKEIRVDTGQMFYNPLDKIGYQQVDKGDKVSVTGRVDVDLFEKREIQADSIMLLAREEEKER